MDAWLTFIFSLKADSCRTRAYNQRRHRRLKQGIIEGQQADLKYLAARVQFADLLAGGAGNTVAQYYLTAQEREDIARHVEKLTGEK